MNIISSMIIAKFLHGALTNSSQSNSSNAVNVIIRPKEEIDADIKEILFILYENPNTIWTAEKIATKTFSSINRVNSLFVLIIQKGWGVRTTNLFENKMIKTLSLTDEGIEYVKSLINNKRE